VLRTWPSLFVAACPNCWSKCIVDHSLAERRKVPSGIFHNLTEAYANSLLHESLCCVTMHSLSPCMCTEKQGGGGGATGQDVRAGRQRQLLLPGRPVSQAT
jgi:hypothetical protein